MQENVHTQTCKGYLDTALEGGYLSPEQGVYLLEHATTPMLMEYGHAMRMQRHPDQEVTWIIDRNSNTTNVCVANCKFCNFFRPPGHKEGYITTLEEYEVKIRELFKYGGEQLLLQGGHHPELGLSFYTQLFRDLKERFPQLKLHALGPPEVAHICKVDGISHTQALTALKEAGLDSLPGAGAEILHDRVRKIISTGKCSGQEWLEVMKAAHQLHITTSATMMFGHIETPLERLEHMVWLREVQDQKPPDAKGFIAFIPWTFQDVDTKLQRVRSVRNTTTGEEYIRMIALSRIMLPNIPNIQASWLTVGKEVAQLCLHAGANDFGSIMIEENVVSAAGAQHWFTSRTIQEAIREAGFHPILRDQEYRPRPLPKDMVEQVLTVH